MLNLKKKNVSWFTKRRGKKKQSSNAFQKFAYIDELCEWVSGYLNCLSYIRLRRHWYV